MDEPLINCLSYALRFWKRCNHYRLYHNSDHVVNLLSAPTDGNFLPIESYGFNYFAKWYDQGLITESDKDLLIEYFDNEV